MDNKHFIPRETCMYGFGIINRSIKLSIIKNELNRFTVSLLKTLTGHLLFPETDSPFYFFVIVLGTFDYLFWDISFFIL